jgi:GTP-binding protein Era
VGVGKSSLVNALVGEAVLATDVAHGCTRQQQAVPWPIAVPGLTGVDLVDTPGIDEVAAAGRARLAARVALQADLVLLVLDGDITRVELEALEALRDGGKPVLPVLNRSDCWPPHELDALLQSIQRRLPNGMVAPVAVAAAPRPAVRLEDGRVRRRAMAPGSRRWPQACSSGWRRRGRHCSPSTPCARRNDCNRRSRLVA